MRIAGRIGLLTQTSGCVFLVLKKLTLLLMASTLFFVSVASASTITYNVTVDTSSISGTTGSFDINFNPGPSTTQSASLQVLNFTGDGSLVGAPELSGNVTDNGGSLTFDNGAALNDFFTGFKFGNMMSFDLSFFGPAVSAPDGVSDSGSSLSFSMFSDAAVPVLTQS